MPSGVLQLLPPPAGAQLELQGCCPGGFQAFHYPRYLPQTFPRHLQLLPDRLHPAQQEDGKKKPVSLAGRALIRRDKSRKPSIPPTSSVVGSRNGLVPAWDPAPEP